jgi:cytochrome c-type biogenesis protein CcmH
MTASRHAPPPPGPECAIGPAPLRGMGRLMGAHLPHRGAPPEHAPHPAPIPGREGRARRGRRGSPDRGGRSRRWGAALAAAVLLAIAAGVAGAAPVSEDTVNAVAAQLRCVVCQNLSVADSPSETARQMRDIVRERLAAGDSPEQVMAYFVDKYGTWILLAPPRQGFTLLVWVAPFAALGIGLVIVAMIVRRWARPGPGARGGPAPSLDAETRARIRREVAELDG